MHVPISKVGVSKSFAGYCKLWYSSSNSIGVFLYFGGISSGERTGIESFHVVDLVYLFNFQPVVCDLRAVDLCVGQPSAINGLFPGFDQILFFTVVCERKN